MYNVHVHCIRNKLPLNVIVHMCMYKPRAERHLHIKTTVHAGTLINTESMNSYP